MGGGPQEAKAIFLEAIGHDSPDELRRFLDTACENNRELRLQVESLLTAHENAGRFLGGADPESRSSVDGDDETVRAMMSHDDKVSLDFLAVSQQPGSLGRLDQYEVTEVVGRGGMGIVLKANDTKLNRIVAVKVLAPELAANPTARKRFRRESRAAAAVSHDHVVTIYAVEDSEPPYLVMEYIDGQSLQQKIDTKGMLEVSEVLRIGRQIALGLAAAHEQGLIHRDVKPSNVLLQNGIERAQLSDFGLARAVDDVEITHTGQITGTPQYMSPEQAHGHKVDSRSDLFSLGCVLYAMSTGRSPFRAESTIATIRRVCDEPARPIQEINTDVPDWLAAIIERLLAKSPEERYQTAEEVADLLGRHLAHLQDPNSAPFPTAGLPPRPKKRHRRNWLRSAAVLAVVVLALGLTEAAGVTQVADFVATIMRLRTAYGTLELVIADPDLNVAIEGNGETFTISGAGVERLDLSPGDYQVRASRNGKPVREQLVTITRGDREVLSLTLERFAAVSPSEIVSDALREVRRFEGHTGPVKQVAFSPDGRLALSGSGYPNGDRSVRLWEVATGKELQHFVPGTQILTVCFSPDGQHVAASGFGGVVHIWNIASGQKTSTMRTNAEVIDDVQYSPDGRQLLCATHTKKIPRRRGLAGWGKAQLWDITTPEAELVWEYESDGWLAACAFLPDDERVVVGGRYTSDHLQILGRAAGNELQELVFGDVGDDEIEDLAVSRDGQLIATASDLGYLTLWDVNNLLEPLSYRSNLGNLRSVAFSPDHSRLLCCGGEADFGTLSLLEVPGLEIIASIDHSAGFAWDIAYSPDGHHALSAGGYYEDETHRDYTLRLWELPKRESPGSTE